MNQWIATTRRAISAGSLILIDLPDDGDDKPVVTVSDGHHSFDVALSVDRVMS